MEINLEQTPTAKQNTARCGNKWLFDYDFVPF